jgi:hypothetical protein
MAALPCIITFSNGQTLTVGTVDSITGSFTAAYSTDPSVSEIGQANPAFGGMLALAGVTGDLQAPVLNADGGIPVHITGSSGAGANASVSNTGSEAPVAATMLGLPNGAGNLTSPIINADGGIPVHVTGGGSNSVGATGAAVPGSATMLAVPNGAGNLTAPVLNADGGLPVHITGGTQGSVGADHSANAPAFPNIGANFGGSGAYANYVLLATVPASPTRTNVDVENSSGAQIVIVRDDGTAANAAPPVNASMFPLGGGVGVGSQGGGWSSATFKGRLQIYGPTAGLFVTVMVD